MVDPIKILLIDDDDKSRIGIAQYLRRSAQIHSASFFDGKSALEHLEKTQSPEEEYTAVVLDYVLTPHLTGQQVMEVINKRYSRLPIIVFTGLDPSGGIETLAQGAYRYLRRPLDYVELITIIQGLAEQDRVYHRLILDIQELLDSDLCIAWRLDKRENAFRITAHDGKVGLDEIFRREALLDANSPALQSFLRRGKPTFMADVRNATKAPHYQYREQAIQFGWQSMFSVPLFHQQRIVGIIDSYTLSPYQLASMKEEKFIRLALEKWAKQAAETIQNAERLKQSQKLQAISELIAGIQQEKTILDHILTSAVTVVGADSGWLYLLDLASNSLKRKAFVGLEENLVDVERSLGEGVTGWTALKGVTALVPNTSVDSRHKPIPEVVITSEIAVPLRRNEQTIGVLAVHSSHQNFFTDDDTRLLFSLATNAATSITHTKLTNHLQEISKLSLLGNYEQLTAYVVKTIQDLTSADASLWLIDNNSHEIEQTLRLVACQGDFPPSYNELRQRMPTNRHLSATGDSLYLKEAKCYKDIQNTTLTPVFYHRNIAIVQNWHSFITVPLLGSEQEPLGALNLYSKEVGKFSQTDVDLVQPFANQVAIALQQQRRSQSLQTLTRIGETLTGSITAQSTLMDQVAKAACDLIGAHCAAIYPYDPTQHDFYERELVGVAGLTEPNREFINKPRKSGLAAMIRQVGELVVCNISEETLLYPVGRTRNLPSQQTVLEAIRSAKFINHEQIQSFAAVSLIASEEENLSSRDEENEVGVLYINFRHPHQFTKEEMQLLRIYAHQVANVIRGARLYLEAQRQANELDALHQTTLNIVSVKEQDELLKAIIRELIKLFDAKAGIIYLRTNDPEVLELVEVLGANSSVLSKGKKLSKDNSAVGQVFCTGTVQIINNYDTWEHSASDLRTEFSAVMAAPLMLGQELIGVISVASDRHKREFGEIDKPIIERFAQQAALAIQNSRLHEGLKRKVNDLEIVNDVVKIINNELKVEPLLKKTVEAIVSTLKCTQCTIFFPVLENGMNFLTPVEVFGPDSARIRKRRFRLDEGIAGKVFKTGLSVLSADVHKLKEFAPAIVPTESIRSMLAVPIRVGEQTIGVVTADEDAYNWFSESDQRFVEALALHVGIATQRATAFEQLQEISLKIAQATDEEAILLYIAEGAVRITNSSFCTIYLLTEDQKEIRRYLQYPSSLGHPMPRFKDKKGLTYKAVHTGKELRVRNAKKDSRVKDELRSSITSVFTLPLKLDGKITGVMHLGDNQAHEYGETESSLVRTLCNQAVISIQKVHLLEQERQAKEEAETLRKVSSAISSNLDIEKTLSVIVENAQKLTASNVGIIHLIDPLTQKLLRNIANPEEFKDFPTRFERKEGFIWHIYHEDCIDVINDMAKSSFATESLIEGKIQSMIGIPLRQRHAKVGVLCLKSYAKNHYMQIDHRVLLVLAEQAALAIERAQRYEQRVKDLSALETINEAILHKSQNDVNKLIVAEAVKLTNATACRLRLVNDDDQLLYLEAYEGAESIHPTLPKDPTSITGHVSLTGQAEIFLNMDDYPYTTRPKRDIKACMCAPLVYDKKVIGTLYVDSEQAGSFSEPSLLELLRVLANQAAIAIVNSKNYQQRAQDIAALQEINQAVVSRSQKEILQLVREKTLEVMKCEYCTIWLLEAGTGNLVLDGFECSEQVNLKEGMRLRPTDNSINRHVINTKKSYICPDTEKDERFMRNYQASKSSLTVPFRYQDELIGTINVESSKYDAFQNRHQQLLESFADQVASAIQARRVYEGVKEQLEFFQLIHGVIAHRANNLAGYIPTRIERAKRKLSEGSIGVERALSDLDAIEAGSRQLLAFAREFKDITGIDSEHKVWIDVNEFMSELINSFQELQSAFRENIRFVEQFDTTIPKISLQTSAAREIIGNLIQNAYDSMKDGGDLVISTSIYTKQKTSYLVIRISDTGTGISEDIKHKIFELDFTTKSQGWGYGLWLSRQLIRRIGGEIELINDNSHKGATFEIQLPLGVPEPNVQTQ